MWRAGWMKNRSTRRDSVALTVMEDSGSRNVMYG